MGQWRPQRLGTKQRVWHVVVHVAGRAWLCRQDLGRTLAPMLAISFLVPTTTRGVCASLHAGWCVVQGKKRKAAAAAEEDEEEEEKEEEPPKKKAKSPAAKEKVAKAKPAAKEKEKEKAKPAKAAEKPAKAAEPKKEKKAVAPKKAKVGVGVMHWRKRGGVTRCMA